MTTFMRMGLITAALGVALPTTFGVTVEPFPGGYCLMLRNGQDPVRDTDYQFENLTGELVILTDGWWDVIYKTTPTWPDPEAEHVDIPSIETSFITGDLLVLKIWGRDVLDYIWLTSVSVSGAKRLELRLTGGGSILPDAVVYGPNFTLDYSLVTGNIDGTLRVATIADQTVNDPELSVSGDIGGLIDVLGDIGANATVLIGGNITSAGAINVAADHSGSLSLAGELVGTIDIGQSVTTGGQVTIGSTAEWSSLTVAGNLAGEIRVDASSWGSITIQEDITADGQVSVDSLGGYYDSIRVWYNHAGQIIVQDIVGDQADINLNLYGGVTSGFVSVGTIVGPEFGVSVMGDLTSTGEITVNSNCGGVYVSGDNSGNISVTQLRGYLGAGANVLSSGRISVGSMSPEANPARIGVKHDFDGVIDIENGVDGEITLNYQGGNTTGDVLIGGTLYGVIDVLGDLDGGRIEITGDVAQTGVTSTAIRVFGSLVGEAGVDPEPPMIEVGGELDGVIAIDGSLSNAVNGDEILVDSLDLENLGAIAIDYTGEITGDAWDDDARIKVGTTEYSGNDPDAHVYEISNCKGDMNNNDELDTGAAYDDPNSFDLSEEDYATTFPGLHGSRTYHGAMNDDGELDDADRAVIVHFAQGDCCFASDDDYGASRVDFDADGDVDLADLAWLLGHYGEDPEDPGWDPLFDIDGNDEIGLADLAEILAYYGDTDTCFSGRDFGGRDGTTVTVTVEAYDTGGYSGGGFNGEVDHFVFDLKIEVNDPNNDDWVATGAVLDASNDAEFRLSLAATYPNQYATFVAAPWTTLPELPNASVVGAYDPPDPDEVFTTTDLNLGWYDTAESNDGPATVMRLVIDVSDVEGADVSEGFGSVYFSTTGPAAKEDILVADLDSGTGTAESAPGLKSLSGEFYVKGE